MPGDAGEKRSRKATERYEVAAESPKKRANTGKPKKAAAAAAGGAKKTKKEKSGVKRPPSAFFIYCADYRAKVKKDNPSFGVTDVAKVLGAMWGKCPAPEKKKYQDKAAKAKAEYEAAVAAAK